MDLKFDVKVKINKPVGEVFQAVIQPEKISSYFCHKMSAPIEEGKTVVWTWNEHGDFPVHVRQVIPNKKIVGEWKSHDKEGYMTRFEMNFESLSDNETQMQVTEGSWKESQEGLRHSYDNVAGWQEMMLCLKAWIEHGIELRK